MEAQGDLLADYFALVLRGRPDAMRWREHAGQGALFEAVLAPFRADPARAGAFATLVRQPAAALAAPLCAVKYMSAGNTYAGPFRLPALNRPSIMRTAAFACLACFLVSAAAAPAGAPRIGDADVRAGVGGVPCFTIAEREERQSGAPSFHAISVVELAGKARLPMWSMAMPAERTFPLLFSMCVPYAGRVASLPQRRAEALETGRVYEVLDRGASRRPARPAARVCGPLLPGAPGRRQQRGAPAGRERAAQLRAAADRHAGTRTW